MGYQASADGTSKGKTKASIGSGQDINGRAIVVHDKTGARVACALIEGKLEESAQCDTGCRDVCNQPFTAGGPDCCGACGCPREDCPLPSKAEELESEAEAEANTCSADIG